MICGDGTLVLVFTVGMFCGVVVLAAALMVTRSLDLWRAR